MQYLMSLKAVNIVCSNLNVRRIRIILVNDGILLSIPIDELENLHADRTTVCFEPW